MSLKKVAIILGTVSSMACALRLDDVDVNLIKQAWKTPKKYYSLEINGVTLKGGHPWEPRWDMIKDVIDFEGKRVIELGANIGITSIFLSRFRGADCTAVNRPQDNKNFLSFKEYSRLLAKGFNTKINYIETDFNKNDYEKVLGTNYDVAICMSIFHWVHDTPRFLRYMSHFDQVLYEGVGPVEKEIALFKSVGFSQHKIIGVSPNQKRVIIVFSK